jgi:hypothetical protein
MSFGATGKSSSKASWSEREAFAIQLAGRQTETVPNEDPDYEDFGRAYPEWQAPERDAILQPPRPLIRPAPRVIEQVKDLEAAY